MRVTVDVKADLLYWAIDRSGKERAKLSKAFSNLNDWLEQRAQPTLKQMEAFAKATFTPIGKFFLDTPPEDRLPIADFRTLPGTPDKKPSPNLLETIYICQQRQEWYRQYCRTEGHEPLGLVGSANTNDSPQKIAKEIRNDFPLELVIQSAASAFSIRRDNIDERGVLVMCSGHVGSSTRRSLDLDEFRGFALSDDYAPIIFVNAKDFNAARSFTLVHELAHIYLGKSGVSNLGSKDEHRTERWCNQVAAEVLVPLGDFKKQFDACSGNGDARMACLTRHYMVSSLVILNRMKDAGFIDEDTFRRLYEEERAKAQYAISVGKKDGSSSGDFYNAKPVAVSKSFGKALTISTLEGNTLYLDAMQMLGVRNISTFNALAAKLHSWIR